MKKQKKVIQIVQHLRPGGLENMALSLLDNANTDQETIVVSLEGNYKECSKNWNKINKYKNDVVFLNKKNGFSVLTLFKLWFFLMKNRPDIVHTHHIGPLFYAGIASFFSGVKVRIHTEHDAWHLNNKKSLKLQKCILRFLNPKIVAVSEIVSQTLKDKIPDSNPIVISNGIDIEEFKPFPKSISRVHFFLPAEKTIIGTAGRLVDVKGHKYLIQSLKNLNENICLAIAGDGDLKSGLIKLTEDLGLSERVFFLGHVDNMKFFYNAIDVFCLPSLAEGLPLALLEAQACNTPCIASDVGGCKEVVSQLSGVLTKAGDVDELGQSINKVLAHLRQYKPRDFVLSYGDANKMSIAYENISN